MFLATPPPFPQQLMALLAQAGYKGVVVNGEGAITTAGIKQLGAAANGSYVVSLLVPTTESSNPTVKLFNKWMNKVNPNATKDETALTVFVSALQFEQIVKPLSSITRASVLHTYETLSHPVTLSGSPSYAVVGRVSPLGSAAPALRTGDVIFSKVEHGVYVPIGGFVNAFAKKIDRGQVASVKPMPLSERAKYGNNWTPILRHLGARWCAS